MTKLNLSISAENTTVSIPFSDFKSIKNELGLHTPSRGEEKNVCGICYKFDSMEQAISTIQKINSIGLKKRYILVVNIPFDEKSDMIK